MRRYSKPLGEWLDFKWDFFNSNDLRLKEAKKIASLYRAQRRRVTCKNCGKPLNFSPEKCFVKLEIEYCFCVHCGHCNGAYEDTETFCRSLYMEDQADFAKTYSAVDIQQYKKRVMEIYLPKAKFLKDALAENGERPDRLADFGAGAGYFVSAAIQCGFSDVTGYEPSRMLANMGNQMLGSNAIIQHDLNDLVALIERSDSSIASFLGVFAHLQNPREVLQTLRQNDRIKYVFFSVPVFSPTDVFEVVFQDVMPRHLGGGHTHLYTERSIQHFCDEFRFKRHSEWWFGLDVCDLYRNVLVSLQRMGTENTALKSYWTERFMPMIDKLQGVLDEGKLCSEVHMLLEKK